jgi:uncharacterized protein (DUF4213/DUF364 family)
MKQQGGRRFFEEARAKFGELVKRHALESAEVSVEVKQLSAREAIGEPRRQDYPIIVGKERVIEAEVLGTKAHSFTDSPAEFKGKLLDVLEMRLDSNSGRAVFIAVMNAVLRYLGMVDATLHCRDEEPEACGREMATIIGGMPGVRSVGLVGLNPAIAQRLVDVFGPQGVRITDLNADNIGSFKFGVEIWDGRTRTEELVRTSDTVLVTGTTIVNGTFDRIEELTRQYGRTLIVFGVTAAGVGALCGLTRLCPYARG